MLRKLIFCLSLVLSSCSVVRPEPVVQGYDSDYERFFQNVVIKQKTPNFITYEYKDVRIDEIASLASRYCDEQGHKTAHLHDAVLFKNMSRRATFDCLELQN